MAREARRQNGSRKEEEEKFNNKKKHSCRVLASFARSMQAADDMYDISGGSGAIRIQLDSALVRQRFPSRAKTSPRRRPGDEQVGSPVG